MLHLLALVVRGQGGEGLESYTTPSERLAEVLAVPSEAATAADRLEARRAEVAAFIAAAGGELG